MRFISDMTVTLIDSCATDNAVARAARVSTGSSPKEPQDDAKLIDWLMRSRHGSPFEHTMMTFLVHAPIFVWREHMRHRAGMSYNEQSGRYMELEPVFYRPATDRHLVQVGKPGAYEFQRGTLAQSDEARHCMLDACDTAAFDYQRMLDAGIAREVARMVLPVNTYSSTYVTMNARSLMHFLSLRTKDTTSMFPSYPQREIEMVAEKYEEHFADLMPATHAAFKAHGRVAP